MNALRICGVLCAVVLLAACSEQIPEKTQTLAPGQAAPLTRLSPDPDEGQSDAQTPLSGREQTIYVPAYSHVYYGQGKDHLLAITLSIRNTSTSDALWLTSVRYYDSEGTVVKQYAGRSLRVPPMATAEFFVEEQDRSGGSGANFLVQWTGRKGISAPVVEAVMISTASQQGIALVSPGRVIAETAR